MSLRNRLQRVRRGKKLPEVYYRREQQEKAIVAKHQRSLTEAKALLDLTPDTEREWKRVTRQREFKAEADPKFLLSYEAFVEEFGMCPEPKYHLCKVKEHYVTWNKHTCEWRRFLNGY